MVNNCIVTNCTSDYVTGEKKPSFLFPKDKDLARNGCISLITKNYAPTISATSTIN